jgi:hypothetical protein
MSTPIVGAYVKVPADCEITYSSEAGDDIAMQLGSLRDGFEVIYERAALARFVEVAQHALSAPVDRAQIGTLAPAAVV